MSQWKVVEISRKNDDTIIYLIYIDLKDNI